MQDLQRWSGTATTHTSNAAVKALVLLSADLHGSLLLRVLVVEDMRGGVEHCAHPMADEFPDYCELVLLGHLAAGSSNGCQRDTRTTHLGRGGG